MRGLFKSIYRKEPRFIEHRPRSTAVVINLLRLKKCLPRCGMRWPSCRASLKANRINMRPTYYAGGKVMR